MTPEQEIFTTGAIRPFACLREGWELVRERYWFLVGVSLMALLMNSVPLVLIGPAVCGLSVIFLNLQRQEPVRFEHFFRGFDHFVPSLLVTLVVFAVQMVLLLPLIALFVGVMIFGVIASAGNGPGVGLLALMIGGGAVAFLGSTLISIAVHLLTFFAYPLLVERKLEALDALRLSARAVKANFWPLAGLFFLAYLIALAGLLCCYVGIFFVPPLILGALFVAYRKIFPPLDPGPPPLPADPGAAA